MTLTGTSSAALGLCNTTDRTGQMLTADNHTVSAGQYYSEFSGCTVATYTVLAGPEIALGKDEATACGNLISHSF